MQGNVVHRDVHRDDVHRNDVHRDDVQRVNHEAYHDGSIREEVMKQKRFHMLKFQNNIHNRMLKLRKMMV